MSFDIDALVLTLNEEEMLPHLLRALEHIGESLQQVVFLDNGSTDATLEILHDWRVGIPKVVLRDDRKHFGQLRSRALELCDSPWVLYADCDETWTTDMREWLASDEKEQAAIWDFMKYSTCVDREHYDNSGNGPATRLFRNLPGALFPQVIHEHPEHPGLWNKRMAGAPSLWAGPLMFDHTGCKSPEALWAKGWRYQWAKGMTGIGPEYEYVWRIDTSLHSENLREFPPEILERIFCGPEAKPGWTAQLGSEARWNLRAGNDDRYPKQKK